MIGVLVLIFAAVALAAAGFVVLPLLRRSTGEAGTGRRPMQAIIAGVATMAFGLGI